MSAVLQMDWLAETAAAYRAWPHELLADTPRARRTDPETSHIAAERVKKSGQLNKQQHAVLEAVRAWPGRTAVELARLSGLNRYAVSRRLPELQPVHVRRGPPRECSINHRPQSTWFPR